MHLCIETTTVVLWSEFPATDTEVQVPFPALPDFPRNSMKLNIMNINHLVTFSVFTFKYFPRPFCFPFDDIRCRHRKQSRNLLVTALPDSE
jgi:hypothetical protein